ncbi:sle1_021 (plasmid) [Streptomyces leeuwenhoekii]|uniref:Sle1_021 protein n=1 Tax=Streptomyces leeuwenhoekii TaxID=1437453 RepID=A0A0F7VM99_STRLW|nr:sle1_021 [Streptomyces leeuwenhoekii]
MALVAGEYEFTCDECDGDGSVQVTQPPEEEGGEPTLGWGSCDDCFGEGRLLVDEEEAAEKIRWGQTPTRTPAAS